MDAHERDARRDIPAGYAIVKDGPILPADLLYSWPAGDFARADSVNWSAAVPADAADCVLVLRKATFDASPYSDRRTYTIRRQATPTPALPDPVSPKKLIRPADPGGVSENKDAIACQNSLFYE